MIKACIFDLDGVIVDTAKYHFIAWRRLANELGFDFDEAFNETLKGVSRMESLDLILQYGGVQLNEMDKNKWANLKNDWYKAFILKIEPSEILPGVKAFLDQLVKADIKIALGSASANAVPILDRLQLTSLFDVIIDGTKTSKSKPDPQVFLMGAQAMGIPPTQCVVFEDAEKGIEAALNGGFWAIGVGEGHALSKAHRVISGFENQDFFNLISDFVQP